MGSLPAVGSEVQKLNKVTDSQLKSFFKENGGEAKFSDFYKRALKAALYAQDDIDVGNYESAGARVDRIFSELPVSSPKWQKLKFRGVHLGNPSCYSALRMIQQIVALKANAFWQTCPRARGTPGFSGISDFAVCLCLL